MNLGDATALGTTIQVDPRQPTFGAVTFVEIGATLDQSTVLLVVPNDRAATAYGALGRGGSVIGGLVHRGGGWDIVAYTDRAALRDTTMPLWYLPKPARSRAAAARALLRWWNRVDLVARDQPERDVRHLDPADLTRRDLALLVA
jgi:hypothetical protein